MQASILDFRTKAGPDTAPPPVAVWLSALEPVALAATQAAAIACQIWVGRGEPEAADEAATEAMRIVLARAPGIGRVVVGEGAKDEAPMLFDGEQLGSGRGRSFDIAVDPVECTKLCAKGLPGSLTTIAFADADSMAPLAGSYYMEKLIGPAATVDALSLTLAPEANLNNASAALGKGVRETGIVVLDKPRNQTLVIRLREPGASVITRRTATSPVRLRR